MCWNNPGNAPTSIGNSSAAVTEQTTTDIVSSVTISSNPGAWFDGFNSGSNYGILDKVVVSVSGGTSTEHLNLALTGTGLSTDGANIFSGATKIGTIAGVGTAQISIDMDDVNGRSSSAASQNYSWVSTLLNNVTYLNDSDAPGASRTVNFTVTEKDGTVHSDSVTLNVTAINDAAVITGNKTAVIVETNDVQTVTGTLISTDPDNAPTFTSQVSTAGTYGKFTLNTNGTWSYTMDTAQNELPGGVSATDTFSVTSIDGTASSVVITINGTDEVDPGPGPVDPGPVDPDNVAPVVADDIADQSAQSGTAFTFTIPAGSFTDADGDPLTYSAASLPAWLTFDAATQTFSGTPTDADIGAPVSVTVIASDGTATATDTFELTVTGGAAGEDPKGTKGNDKLVGDDGDNILDGKRGNDKLTGGDGADTFIFGKKYGRDIITDFDPSEGDKIDLSDAVGIKGFRDLVNNHAVDTGDHVKITTDDGSILVIKNFDLDDLSRDMFIF